MKIIFTSNVIFENSRHEVGDSLDISEEKAEKLVNAKIAKFVNVEEKKTYDVEKKVEEKVATKTLKNNRLKKAGRK